MNQDKPELSIVVTARNDDHGGNLLQRMQLFVNGLLEQARRFGLQSELIIVEWNPPGDKPGLKNVLTWPSGLEQCLVRIIEVPPEVHARYRYADKLPLYQMIAKNVGIRRARGRFVLATNVDLLFTDELIKFLASGKLDPKAMYRIDRYDAPSKIPAGLTVTEQLQFCKHHVIRVNTQDGTFSGYRATIVSKLGLALRVLYPSEDRGRIIIKWFKLWKRFFRPTYPRLHTNACGDFTLLSKQAWFALRGYPELDMFSFYIDSLLLHMAYQYGLKQRILRGSMRVYHIEHAAGWSPEQGRQLLDRMVASGVPVLTPPQFGEWASLMQRKRAPIISNTENWGLASENLSEAVIGSSISNKQSHGTGLT